MTHSASLLLSMYVLLSHLKAVRESLHSRELDVVFGPCIPQF